MKKSTVNLIDHDPLVKSIFDAVSSVDLKGADTIDKLRAVVRAGKIAEAYMVGGLALQAARNALNRKS